MRKRPVNDTYLRHIDSNHSERPNRKMEQETHMCSSTIRNQNTILYLFAVPLVHSI